MGASFDAELALDRLEAELALELPGHLRAFAGAYAAGVATPPAPAVACRSTSLVAARAALDHPILAGRALALTRLLAPIAIEDDPRVIAAWSPPSASWDRYADLAAARDAAARARFGLGFIELVHRLHGAPESAESAGWPDPIAGWNEPPGDAIDAATLERTWRDLAGRFGARGTCRIVRSAARPRAFVVDRHEVVVVVGAIATPAARFAALHELGHAIAALVAGTLPRVVDEATAAYVARQLEVEAVLGRGWFSTLAEPARHRRRRLAAALDRIERGIEPGGDPLERPPWALWHDPGAQAAYVAAEHVADRWWATLGPDPDPAAFAGVLADERARVDGATTLRGSLDDL